MSEEAKPDLDSQLAFLSDRTGGAGDQLAHDHKVRNMEVKSQEPKPEPGTFPESEREARPTCCGSLGLFSSKKSRRKQYGAKQAEIGLEVDENELVPRSKPPAELQLLQGKYHDEFLQHRVLGQGGSYVYLATRKSTRARSAVKVVSLDVAVPEWCLREFYILRQLDHPNVIRLLDAWQETKMLYLETELCDRTLRRVLDHQEEIPRQAWYQIVSALAYLHGKGIVHRDLAPKNIFLTKNGQVKVGDFGLSKQVDDETSNSPRRKTGTLGYNSASARANNLKTDVHALGILLLDMLLVKQNDRGEMVWNFSRHGIVPEVLKEPRNHYYFEKVSVLTAADRDSRPTAAEILEDDSFQPLFDCNFADALM